MFAYLLETPPFNLLLSSISSHDVNLIGQAICPKLSLIRTSHDEYWHPALLLLPPLPCEAAELGGVGLSLPLCSRSERCRRHRRWGEEQLDPDTFNPMPDSSEGIGGVDIREFFRVFDLLEIFSGNKDRKLFRIIPFDKDNLKGKDILVDQCHRPLHISSEQLFYLHSASLCIDFWARAAYNKMVMGGCGARLSTNKTR